MSIQGWFPLGLTGLISLQSKGLSRVFSNTTVQKHQFFGVQPSLWSNSHIWKDHRPLSIQTWVNKVIYLLCNTLSMFVTAFKTYSSVLPKNIKDWFPLGWPGTVQGTLKSLQHHTLKASILQHSAVFMVYLSHPYMTTGKTIALTRGTFVDKVISLLFNMLSR